MPTINIKDSPEFKTVRLIDLSEDSINEIAEAVVSKLDKSVRHGQWLKNGDRYCECSVCHHEGNISGADNYCWYCGAGMREAEDSKMVNAGTAYIGMANTAVIF